MCNHVCNMTSYLINIFSMISRFKVYLGYLSNNVVGIFSIPEIS